MTTPFEPLTWLIEMLRDVDRPGIWRGDAIARIVALQSPELLAQLRELTAHDDAEIQCDAAEVLLRMDHDLGISATVTLLRDSKSYVRSYAAGLLGDFGNRGDLSAIDGLSHALLNDSDVYTRLVAAWALGEIGANSAIPALQEAVANDTGEDHEGRTVRSVAESSIEMIRKRQGC